MNKKLIIIVACPGRGAGNDPEPLMLAFQQDPTFLMQIFHIDVIWG